MAIISSSLPMLAGICLRIGVTARFRFTVSMACNITTCSSTAALSFQGVLDIGGVISLSAHCEMLEKPINRFAWHWQKCLVKNFLSRINNLVCRISSTIALCILTKLLKIDKHF